MTKSSVKTRSRLGTRTVGCLAVGYLLFAICCPSPFFSCLLFPFEFGIVGAAKEKYLGVDWTAVVGDLDEPQIRTRRSDCVIDNQPRRGLAWRSADWTTGLIRSVNAVFYSAAQQGGKRVGGAAGLCYFSLYSFLFYTNHLRLVDLLFWLQFVEGDVVCDPPHDAHILR